LRVILQEDLKAQKAFFLDFSFQASPFYISGILVLYLSLLRGGSTVGIWYILNIGFFPFIVGDIAKLLLAFGFAKGIKRV